MVALTILSVALLAVSYTAVAGHQHLGYADETSRASRLAEDLVEEIVSKPYAEPGGAGAPGRDAGEFARPSFDDVDDYDGYAEAAGELADFTGARYGAPEQAFSRSVSVTTSDQAVPALGRTIPGKTVTVRVTHPRGVQCQVARFIPEP
jgi:hypothetical protein